MIREETKYITDDGETFLTLKEAEQRDKELKEQQQKIIDNKIKRDIYKNLFEFLKVKDIIAFSVVFDLLVDNKKEIILLLTNGNLDTVYTPRTFEKT